MPLSKSIGQSYRRCSGKRFAFFFLSTSLKSPYSVGRWEVVIWEEILVEAKNNGLGVRAVVEVTFTRARIGETVGATVIRAGVGAVTDAALTGAGVGVVVDVTLTKVVGETVTTVLTGS